MKLYINNDVAKEESAIKNHFSSEISHPQQLASFDVLARTAVGLIEGWLSDVRASSVISGKFTVSTMSTATVLRKMTVVSTMCANRQLD